MLAEHPAVLSAAEVFTMAQPGAFPAGEIDGERFWRVLAEPRADMSLLLRHRVEPDEVRYPVDGGGRFDRESGVPPIALICLPTLTDEPDALYDELERPLRRLPPARVGTHYRSLLELLARILGKQVWVERSGGSLSYAGDVLEQFDSPRVLHVHRAGPDTALSMSRHSSYRITIVRALLKADLGRDPFEAAEPPPGRAPAPELAGLTPDRFDARAFREAPIPVEHFGRFWSAAILRGTRQLAALPASDVRHLPYEQLVADPEDELARVAELFELPDPRGPWLKRAATAAGEPAATARDQLSGAELERLRLACAPGERRLRRLAQAGDRS